MPSNQKLKAQAQSIARLGEHTDDIHDPALRSFVSQIIARVTELQVAAEAEGAVADSKNILVVRHGQA